jgi:hypothetical protein
MIAAFQAAERGSIPRYCINISILKGAHFFWLFLLFHWNLFRFEVWKRLEA